MSVISISPPPLSTRRRLPGSPHWGRDWQHAVRNLRAAVGNAHHHAKRRSHFTTDKVGVEVIDLIGQLDSRALPVLHVLIGELAKQSRHLRD
jgi:hypothetical protein